MIVRILEILTIITALFASICGLTNKQVEYQLLFLYLTVIFSMFQSIIRMIINKQRNDKFKISFNLLNRMLEETRFSKNGLEQAKENANTWKTKINKLKEKLPDDQISGLLYVLNTRLEIIEMLMEKENESKKQ